MVHVLSNLMSPKPEPSPTRIMCDTSRSQIPSPWHDSCSHDPEMADEKVVSLLSRTGRFPRLHAVWQRRRAVRWLFISHKCTTLKPDARTDVVQTSHAESKLPRASRHARSLFRRVRRRQDLTTQAPRQSIVSLVLPSGG